MKYAGTKSLSKFKNGFLKPISGQRFPSLTLENLRKQKCFLTFQEGMESEHWS